MRRAGGLATKGSGGSVNRTFDPRAPRTQGDVKQKKVWPTERKLIEQKRVCTVWIAVTLHLGLCRRASALVTELFIYFFLVAAWYAGRLYRLLFFVYLSVCGQSPKSTYFGRCLVERLSEGDEIWQLDRGDLPVPQHPDW